MHAGFEGSYLGDRQRISAETRMECRVCWYIYDPAAGDDVYQIPAGTAFADLPGDWVCPECDGSQQQFMVLQD